MAASLPHSHHGKPIFNCSASLPSPWSPNPEQTTALYTTDTSRPLLTVTMPLIQIHHYFAAHNNLPAIHHKQNPSPSRVSSAPAPSTPLQNHAGAIAVAALKKEKEPRPSREATCAQTGDPKSTPFLPPSSQASRSSAVAISKL
ncbi:hypothetical protein M0R45_031986 [Rubus argutus]|uniref:Uncharacterized protein n=1 Tax=Rubus argutus TaxID=59490 RepID=A0AAW1WGA5_RUBAR